MSRGEISPYREISSYDIELLIRNIEDLTSALEGFEKKYDEVLKGVEAVEGQLSFLEDEFTEYRRSPDDDLNVEDRLSTIETGITELREAIQGID